ncbi:MAG: sialate O-acetylesterase [Kiritimatiellia bacterium]
MNTRHFFWIMCVGLAAVASRADVTPHAICSDGMVLQQQAYARLWGTADTGEVVTVTFRGTKGSATAGEDGSWVVPVAAGEAGGPFPLTIAGANTISFSNVMVGEVWLCAGQANMQWTIEQTGGSDKEFALAEPPRPMLRMFLVPAGTWVEAKPETVEKFSAVAYYFGRNLQESRKVSVGLIQASVGLSPIETWVKPAILPAKKPRRTSLSQPSAPSSTAYLDLIYPLLEYRIKGVAWYHGESNALGGGRYADATQYRSILPALMAGWRKDFDLPDLAFHIVQLQPYQASTTVSSGWAGVRDAQTLAALWNKHSGLIVTTDCGDEKEIRPSPKRPVGERLALAARGITYGEKIVYAGPMCRSVTFDGQRAILSYLHAGGGLVSRELVATANRAGNMTAWRAKEGAINTAPLTGYTMCGTNGIFLPAQAEIVGDTVILSNRNVGVPVAVYYGAADHPSCNLYNREGLPASPFRTDVHAAPVTLRAGEGGAVSPGKAFLAMKNQAVPILAAPARNYAFKEWTLMEGTATIADRRAASTTVAVSNNAVIQANFANVLSCAVTVPTNPLIVKAGSKVKLAATTAIAHGNSTVQKVEYYAGDVKIGEALAKPYAFTWARIPAGSCRLTARATDSGGAAAISAPVFVVATVSGKLEGLHASGGEMAYYVEGGTNWTAHIFAGNGSLDVKGSGAAEFLVVGGGGVGVGTPEGNGGCGGGFVKAQGKLSENVYSIIVGEGGGRKGLKYGMDSVIACAGKDVVRAAGGEAAGAGQNAGGTGCVSTMRDGVTAISYALDGLSRNRVRNVPLGAREPSKENSGYGGDGGSGNAQVRGSAGIVIVRYVTGGK